ncbi:hypothetical protein SteCoe_6483 [Stentor coeruleus]|uniref:SANT domain-containing protein n=1 Tax=Stentor coeruleus TaxID=5963 RepID=A0A1R2CPU6_9CILI|nr:hypothetical protein SteCoe_6483 [Stentor coeruleus]
MQTDSSSLTSNTTGNIVSHINEEKSAQFQDMLDWSSEYEVEEGSSDLSVVSDIQFKAISPLIFKKASRKWLNSNSQNYFSQAKNTADLSKDQILAGKALQSFENYLSIVSLMYFGDPFSKSKSNSDVFRPGKRARSRQISDPLSMIVSPLRTELEFETWSPKQIAVFECTLCSFGKKFDAIEKLLTPDKAIKDITKFYYSWKKTSHYKAWKETVRESMFSSACS